MKSILFVDDEPKVLDGLRRMLRGLRHEWSMEFITRPEDALQYLATNQVDVLVSDLRMPGMDGAELMSRVKELYPHVIRIILSGQSDKEKSCKAVESTHQFLAKPCDAETLQDAILRTSARQARLNSDAIKKLVSGLTTLPSPPAIWSRLIEILNSPDASIADAGVLISQDLAMSAKILQVVNSSFFGLPRHISGPEEAVALLGVDTVKALVISVGVFLQHCDRLPRGVSLEHITEHSLQVGLACRRIAEFERMPAREIDDAFMAGLLHDVGKLIFIGNYPREYEEALDLAKSTDVPVWQAESAIFGASHADVGAYLLVLWGLPETIVDAVAFHHTPAEWHPSGVQLATIVHVADTLSSHGVEDESSLEKQSLQDSPEIQQAAIRWREIILQSKNGQAKRLRK